MASGTSFRANSLCLEEKKMHQKYWFKLGKYQDEYSVYLLGLALTAVSNIAYGMFDFE
jgi:hypothetical protein